MTAIAGVTDVQATYLNSPVQLQSAFEPIMRLFHQDLRSSTVYVGSLKVRVTKGALLISSVYLGM